MVLSEKIAFLRKKNGWSQEELAEKLDISRQSVSKWELGKSYPDIHSLLLLSTLFNISLDQLIKGDLEIMKEEISKKEIQEFNFYGGIFSILLIGTTVTVAPLAYFLGIYGIGITFVLFVITIAMAYKVEGYKKRNNIQTYKEILAFCNGERLDEIAQKQEEAKRPYQDILKVLISGSIGFIVTMVLFKLLEMLFG